MDQVLPLDHIRDGIFKHLQMADLLGLELTSAAAARAVHRYTFPRWIILLAGRKSLSESSQHSNQFDKHGPVSSSNNKMLPYEKIVWFIRWDVLPLMQRLRNPKIIDFYWHGPKLSAFALNLQNFDFKFYQMEWRPYANFFYLLTQNFNLHFSFEIKCDSHIHAMRQFVSSLDQNRIKPCKNLTIRPYGYERMLISGHQMFCICSNISGLLAKFSAVQNLTISPADPLPILTPLLTSTGSVTFLRQLESLTIDYEEKSLVKILQFDLSMNFDSLKSLSLIAPMQSQRAQILNFELYQSTGKNWLAALRKNPPKQLKHLGIKMAAGGWRQWTAHLIATVFDCCPAWRSLKLTGLYGNDLIKELDQLYPSDRFSPSQDGWGSRLKILRVVDCVGSAVCLILSQTPRIEDLTIHLTDIPEKDELSEISSGRQLKILTRLKISGKTRKEWRDSILALMPDLKHFDESKLSVLDDNDD